MTIEPRSGYYVSQRLRLHYSEWGDPGAPPLILQHGGRDHGRSWDRVVEALLPDWRIIAPDLRGHGDSEWAADGAYAMEDFLYDHAMLFDALKIERATVVGHSLGGNIALRHAAIRRSGSRVWLRSRVWGHRPPLMPGSLRNRSATGWRPG